MTSKLALLLGYVTALAGAVVAGLATLPYGWARIGAAAVGGVIAALHATVAVTGQVMRAKLK
jgi:hypothetical protein